MSSNNRLIMTARDISAAFKLLTQQPLQNIDYLRAFVNEYAVSQRAQIDLTSAVSEMICEIGRKHCGSDGKNFGLLYNLEWRMGFHQLFNHGGKQSEGVFVTFTGVVKGAKHPKLQTFLRRKVEEYPDLDIADFHDGVAISRGFWLSSGWSTVSNHPVRLAELKDIGPAYFDDHKRISARWAELIVKSYHQTISENQEQVVSVQENNGKLYYNQETLSAYFRHRAANDELVDIIKFVDSMTSKWSRHLVLNTHKKQTEQTPRYSVAEGPGILTVLLERSDLEVGERAPQLQMIFNRSDAGIAITPRIAGCMTTSRMIDTFDQINRELLAGETVRFTSADQIVTYVEQVSAHSATAIGFRQELGDPKAALIAADKPDLRIAFTAELEGDQVKVQTLIEDEDLHADNVVNTILLDNIGKEGQIQLEISAKTRFNSAQAQAQELHESAPFQQVWSEVRDTPATSDANIAAAEAVLQEELAPQDSVDRVIQTALVEIPAIDSTKHLYIEGDDEHMLTHLLDRLAISNIGMRDKRALTGFRHFVLEGEGLANVDQWGFHARTVRDGGAGLSENFLRSGNNFFITIYDRDVKLTQTQLASLVIFQCKIDA